MNGHTLDNDEINRVLGVCGPLAAIQTPSPGDFATYNFPKFAKLVTFAFYQDAIDAQAVSIPKSSCFETYSRKVQTFRGNYRYRLQALHAQFKAGEVGPWGMPRIIPVEPPRSTISRGLDILSGLIRFCPQHDRRRRARYDPNDWTVAEGWSGTGNTELTQLNVRRGEGGRRSHLEDKDECKLLVLYSRRISNAVSGTYVSNLPTGTGVRELFEHFSVEGHIIGIAYVTTLDLALMTQG